MNLPAIKADLLSKVQIEPGTTAPAAVLTDVLTAINSAAQFMNMAGHPFWATGRETVSLGSTVTFELDDARAVKKVLRMSNGLPLLRADSLSEVVNFFYTHFAKADVTVDYLATIYHCEQGEDATKLSFTFGPAPLRDQEVEITYAPTFTNYTSADLDNAAKSPDVGAGYVETLFLPLARFYISRSQFFNNDSLKASIEADYGMAFNLVRSINPALRLPSDEQVRRAYGGQRGGER
jgi:hypothetical protein